MAGDGQRGGGRKESPTIVTREEYVSGVEHEDIRIGNFRKSQETNTLLLKPKLGQVKRPIINLPPPEFAYGHSKMRDIEGAKEVINTWVQHVPDPDAKPGPNFIAMNMLSMKEHCITSGDQRDFRKDHTVRLKTGSAISLNKKPALPSDGNSDHVYGRPTGLREFKSGALAREMTALMQNAYGGDWVAMNEARMQRHMDAQAEHVVSKTTRAAEGHAFGASQKLNADTPKDRFILSKFKTVPHRIDNVQTTPLKRD